MLRNRVVPGQPDCALLLRPAQPFLPVDFSRESVRLAPYGVDVQSIVFQLTNETALFMHGAGGLSSAELRPSAFKGAMRYWFRALYGAGMDGAALARTEDLHCGSRIGACPFRLLIESRRPKTAKGVLLPHKEESRAKRSAAIIPGLHFALRAECSPPHALSAPVLWSLWTALVLGGFGQRSRRGAGSLRLSGAEPADAGVPVFSREDSPDSLQEKLSLGLAKAFEAAPRLPENGSIVDLPPFPVLRHAEAKARIVLVPLPDLRYESQARSWLMDASRPFKDPAFGLPLRTADALFEGRHASPVWMRLTALGGRWMAIVTVLRSPLAARATPSKLDQFIEALLQTPGSREVTF